MKKICVIALVLFGVFVISACSVQNIEKDSLKFKNEYEKLNGEENEKTGKITRTLNIDEDNPFIYSSEDEIVNMIENKETFVVYFGFSSCPWCRSVLESLIKAAKDTKTNKIYYVDVKNIRNILSVDDEGNIKVEKEGSKGYEKLLVLLDNVLDVYSLVDNDGNEVITNEKRIYAPNVVGVVNGNPIELETGMVDELTDPYMELTKDIREEMYDEFEDLFEEVFYDSTCEIGAGC